MITENYQRFKVVRLLFLRKCDTKFTVKNRLNYPNYPITQIALNYTMKFLVKKASKRRNCKIHGYLTDTLTEI